MKWLLWILGKKKMFPDCEYCGQKSSIRFERLGDDAYVNCCILCSHSFSEDGHWIEEDIQPFDT